MTDNELQIIELNRTIRANEITRQINEEARIAGEASREESMKSQIDAAIETITDAVVTSDKVVIAIDDSIQSKVTPAIEEVKTSISEEEQRAKTAESSISSQVSGLSAQVSTLDTKVNAIRQVSEGGTGATTAAGARTNLGLGTLATKSTITNEDIANLAATKLTGILPVSKGGTGTNDLDTIKNSFLAWNNLGSKTGNSEIISLDLSGYTEVMITCAYGKDSATPGVTYFGTIVLPVSVLTSQRFECYLGGGVHNTSSGAGRLCWCYLTNNSFQGGGLRTDQTDRVNHVWTIYAR